MARRDRDEDPEAPPPERDARRRLENVIPDLIKKAVLGGYDRASGGAETIKSFISESKLPKEIAHAIFQQIDDTKSGLFRVVAKEIRGFLEAVDFQREIQKLLTTVSFEIKTEIRFIPNDSAPDKIGRPQVKADMKIKRQGERDRDDKRRGKRGEDRGPREEPPPDEPPPEPAPPPPEAEPTPEPNDESPPAADDNEPNQGALDDDGPE